MGISISEVRAAADWAEARRLIECYVDSLGIDLSFQNTAAELAQLDTVYGRPDGALFLAREGGMSLGCAGLRHFSPDEGEMKRLYVVPAARGRGVGHRLASAVIERARSCGYRRLLLDTLPTMTEARAMYLRLGFAEIPPYRINPVAGTRFMALDLDGTPGP